MSRTELREPLHPPSTHFPMALFPMAVVFDVLALAQADATAWVRAAFVVMVTAMIASGFAVFTGFVHFFRDVRADSDSWRVAVMHMSVQLVAVSVLLISLLLRAGHLDANRPPMTAVALAVVGTTLMLFGGWLGGRLVYTHAVGVRMPSGESCNKAADRG